MRHRSSFLKIHCLDFMPIFEVGSYWFRIGAYCYEAIIINNVFYCFCQGETFEKVRVFGSCLRRKQPSEYPLLLTTKRLGLFSPVYFFSYCSRPIVFVIFGNARFFKKMLHEIRWFTRIRRFAEEVFVFLHTRKEMGEYVLIKSYIYMLTMFGEKNTRLYVNVHKFLTNFKTCILLFKKCAHFWKCILRKFFDNLRG